MRFLLVFCASLFGCSIKSSTSSNTTITQNKVVPQAEYKAGQGPTETKGITKVEVLGIIDLQTEFEGFSMPIHMRARRLSIDETGVVAAHEHQARPGIAVMLSGEMTEFRDTQSFVRKVGDHSFEKTGVTHWWENKSGAPAQALVVDILTPKEEVSLTAFQKNFEWKEAPTENVGLSITKKAMLSLSGEDTVLSNKSLRLRVVDVAPDGVVGNHLHTSRPGFAYIVHGTLVEYRNDQSTSQKHETGTLVVEQNGVQHYWKNESGQTATVMVVDIVPTPKE